MRAVGARAIHFAPTAIAQAEAAGINILAIVVDRT
jgi:hypothetical protein